MLNALLVSFGVVVVAEVGDKSQLMALAFALRYPAVPVLMGITAATALLHALSVAAGAAAHQALPEGWVSLVAAAAFVGFALWTLRAAPGPAGGTALPRGAGATGASAFLASAGAFLVAEFGDKTMLATITLATQHEAVGTWVGSTLGMVVADAAAIVAGRQLGSRLPSRAVRVGVAACFVAFAGLLALRALAVLLPAGP